MKIYKEPKFENDSYMFVLEESDVLADFDESIYPEKYVKAKIKAFMLRLPSKRHFEDFSDRSSLRNLKHFEDLAGSIYTYTCQSKNKLDYNHIIKYCKRFYKTSRNCNINFADTLQDYLDYTKNTSCLNSIHYYKDNVTLYFRASDIKMELLLDLRLIIKFFIKPVGDFKTITVVASTAQNTSTNLSTLIQ